MAFSRLTASLCSITSLYINHLSTKVSKDCWDGCWADGPSHPYLLRGPERRSKFTHQASPRARSSERPMLSTLRIMKTSCRLDPSEPTVTLTTTHPRTGIRLTSSRQDPPRP